MKCGRICLSHGGQLPVLHRRKGSQHFMNQAKFHSTFPILLLLKSLFKRSLVLIPSWVNTGIKNTAFSVNSLKRKISN